MTSYWIICIVRIILFIILKTGGKLLLQWIHNLNGKKKVTLEYIAWKGEYGDRNKTGNVSP
jgi:hypothetical protein